MNIQPKDSSGGGGETREAVVFRLADDMLGKLPPDYIPHEVRSRLQKMGAMSSMNIFLRQEIDRMQRVIALVRHTLQDLKLAIEGTIIMSEVMLQQWYRHTVSMLTLLYICRTSEMLLTACLMPRYQPCGRR